MKFRTMLVCTILMSCPVFVQAQNLEPTQIGEHLLAAYQTLDFSSVSPYVHTKTLKMFRRTSLDVIGRAAEKYGEAPLVEFFGGASLQDLASLSDEDYWARMMAATLRFAEEKPANVTQPVAQFADSTGLVLVYSGRAALRTAPDAGSFVWHRAYSFEQENGAWKLSSLIVDEFEASLCAFLESKNAVPRP